MPSSTVEIESNSIMKYIDVWWISDDGGLTILLPHLLRQSQRYRNHKLRVFTLTDLPNCTSNNHSNGAGGGNRKRSGSNSVLRASDASAFHGQYFLGDENNKEAANPTSSRQGSPAFFFHSPGVAAPPLISRDERRMIRLLRKLRIQAEFPAVQMQSNVNWSTCSKIERCHLLGELLRERSSGADLVFVTLPLPDPVEMMGEGEYMTWLESMTNGLPTTVIMRGNNKDVLTLYS